MPHRSPATPGLSAQQPGQGLRDPRTGPYQGGWVFGRGSVVAFDFRRNRERVLVLLDRADQFHRSATLSLSEGLVAPAVEHLCSAAEQAVMTLIQLDGWNDGKKHQKRRNWLASEVQHGGVPASFSAAFEALLDDRNAARYGEAPVALDAAGTTAVAGDVRALIDYARARRG